MEPFEPLFQTLCKQLDNYNELLLFNTNILNNLRLITERLKCNENRIKLSVCQHYWNILTQFANNIVNHLTDNRCESGFGNDIIVIQIITELFRLLRNCCVNCTENQSIISSNHSLFNDCCHLFKSICDLYLRINTDVNHEMKSQLIVAIKCGLQYFVNLLAKPIGCESFDKRFECEKKHKIWQKFGFDLFSQLLTFNDYNVSVIASAVFYNCMNGSDLIEKSITDAKLLPIIDTLLRDIGEQRSEWSLYSIERSLIIKDFLSHVFANLCSKSKIILLDVISEWIENDSKTDEQNELCESNLRYLVELFKSTVEDVVSIDKPTNTDNYDLNVILAPKLLSLLCQLSANKRYLTQLQNDIVLIRLLVDTLKSIHILGKTDKFSKFKPLRQLKLVTENDIEVESPVFGFKRNVIRAIGNLVYDCVQMQNAVRESEGIVVILDCCNIDARNPFIMEWSIFAIRNLMNGNADNQRLIRNLSINGDIISDEITKKLGID